MGELWYTDKEQCGIFYSGWDAERVYDGYKKYHLNPNSSKYGAVLLTTKRVHTGWEIRIKLFFRDHWYWKPSFRWKYGERHFHWLFFMFWLEKTFVTRPVKVCRDHLKESQEACLS